METVWILNQPLALIFRIIQDTAGVEKIPFCPITSSPTFHQNRNKQFHKTTTITKNNAQVTLKNHLAE